MSRRAITSRSYDRSAAAMRARAIASKQRRAQRLLSSRVPKMLGTRYGPELKVIDVNKATYAANAGAITQLAVVAAGTDYTARIGRKIMLKSLYITGLVYPEDDATLYNLARLMVVYDSQPNGASPAVLDVLNAADSTSHLNLDNRDRFKVLVDKRWVLGKVNTTATQAIAASPTCEKVQIYRKFNLEEVFNGTGGTISAVITGALFMLTIGNNAATDGATFSLSTRVRFTDV